MGVSLVSGLVGVGLRDSFRMFGVSSMLGMSRFATASSNSVTVFSVSCLVCKNRPPSR